MTIRIGDRPYRFPYGKTFMEVPAGQPLLYIDSDGRVGVALNKRDFSKQYKISPPVSIFIPKRGL